MRKKYVFSAFVWALTLCFLTAGSAFADKKKVEIAYVEWSSEVASSNVVKAVLQEKMGYKCELTAVSVGPMYVAVAAGDVDGMVASWQPLQKANLDKVASKLDDLGPNMEGVLSGLVVPDYVTINSIEEMNANADKFDGKIIGIDPGAGIMQKSEIVIKDYGLSKFKLMESTGAMMVAALKDAIRQKKWVVVTGWTPHWKWGVWKLKYLKDPKAIYGKVSDGFIKTLVRKGLKKDMPDVYKFLDNFKWTGDEMAAVMVAIKDGMKPYDAAKKWISENGAKVDGWLK